MAQEVVQLPDDIRQLHQLLTWLSQRHDRYAAAFARCSCVRAAINERHADARQHHSSCCHHCALSSRHRWLI